MLGIERSDDGVLTLTLDRVELRNALDYDMVGRLVAAFRDADADESVRCVLLTARGPVFSAGADLKQFRRELEGDAEDFFRSGRVWQELFTFVPEMRVPLVVAVNGAARAGAVGVVALADFVVASESSSFGLAEINIGLFPIVVLPILIRVIGFRGAQDLAMTGRVVGADEARTMGLVTTVVDDSEVEQAARDLAGRLAGKPATALGYGRRLLAELADRPYADAVAHARAMRGVFLSTDDVREGVGAFLEKREPRWNEGGAT